MTTRESAQPTMMASGACPSASGAKSSGLRPWVGELTLDETLVALDELGEHSVGVAGGGGFAPGGFFAGSGEDGRGEGEAGRADRQSREPQELATR